MPYSKAKDADNQKISKDDAELLKKGNEP